MLLQLLLGVATACFVLFQFPQTPRSTFKGSPQPSAPLNDDLHDNSDWFSGLRPSGGDGELAGEVDDSSTQEREVSPTNFAIAGIDISPKMFKPIEEKFGALHVVERGDASSGRSQACYVSPDGKIYLVFEQGEVDSSVYLFAGGLNWYGSDRCIPSKLVSEKLSTASGLRLGLAPVDLIAILGKPSRCQIPAPFTTSIDSMPNNIPYSCGHRPTNNSSETELLYSLHKTRTLTVQECAKVSRNNPTETPGAVNEQCTYDWSAGIDARFTHSRMTFLAVSISETN